MDTWLFEETAYSSQKIANSESLFSIGNGYLGFRGFFCEREPSEHPGVFINAFYELSPIVYGEDAYGFARWNQTMLDLPDARFITLSIDGEEVWMDGEQVKSFTRTLDMRRGLLVREVLWKTKNGKEVCLTWQSLISMEYQHLGAVKLTVSSSEPVKILVSSSIGMPKSRSESGLDPRRGTSHAPEALTCTGTDYYDSDGLLGFEASFVTAVSALQVRMRSAHRCQTDTIKRFSNGRLPGMRFSYVGSTFTFEKYFTYQSAGRPGEAKILGEAIMPNREWEELVRSQENHYRRFWNHADVQVEGNDRLQLGLRLNLFQIHQSVGRDGHASLAAKGLTGSGYEGHYFWDTEIYGMPFFSHTDASTARALIQYRIQLLDHARKRAREMSQKGVLYPWRTINGLEASAYFPAGTAQYHINADIAYSIFQYLDASGDESILEEGAAELLLETARLWNDLGFYNPRKGGRFCINEVTGPDEYSALVDNNLYTNVMAQYHLDRTVKIANKLKAKLGIWERIVKSVNLGEQELQQFADIARNMYIPFDSELGINQQDDSFLEKEEWNVEKKGKLCHPMLLNYHPLVIYRHRVIKQADTVLAMLLRYDAFPWYLRRRNYLFYERLTTGDSSLSACIQGIVGFDCGQFDMAMEYTMKTALMDLDDLHHNTRDGLHTAAMAGSWMAIVYGIAGFRMQNGVPFFRPYLPPTLKRISFTLTFGGVRLSVDIRPEGTTYSAEGKLVLNHRSSRVEVGLTPLVMPTHPVCKAVIFDLDGVITSTDAQHYRAWKHLAEEQHWDFNEEINQQLRGVSRRRSLQIILDHNGKTIGEDEVLLLTERKNAWYRESLAELTPMDILPGIKDLLGQLKELGLKTAIASASRNAPYILDKIGIKDQFDVVVDAAKVIKGKPDPEVFVRAAEVMGILPEECTAVEDSAAGIDAINAAMMRAVGIGSAVDSALCAVHVPSTDKLTVQMMLF